MLAHAQPVPVIRSRGEIQLPRAVYTWVNDPARETQVPVNQITDDEIAYLRALVERERASTNYHTTRENILLAGIERAIRALKDERDRSTRARMILTMVWQSRRLLTGDLWIVTDRDMDDMACRMVELYFGGPYDHANNPRRRRTDDRGPNDREH